MKRLLMIAAAVAVLGLAAVAVGGVVTSAQEGDGPIGSFLAKVADKLGVSEDELKGAIEEAKIESIDEAVAEGRLTEEQAERARESGFPLRARFRGAGEHKGYVIEAAAQVLDMSQEELKDELKDGNSLAEIVEAQGMTVDDFKAELLNQLQALLDSDVADGTLTQEQADRLSEGLEKRIDNIVNAQPGEGGFGGPRHRHGGFGGPWHVPLGEAEEASEVTA
jgi:polyhydroxyalkanoate synthesis regulator phasin